MLIKIIAIAIIVNPLVFNFFCKHKTKKTIVTIIIDKVLGLINPTDIESLRPMPALDIPSKYRKQPIKKIELNESNNVSKISSNLTFRDARIRSRYLSQLVLLLK